MIAYGTQALKNLSPNSVRMSTYHCGSGGHNPGGTHRQARTLLGTDVVEQLVDYSFDPNGG